MVMERCWRACTIMQFWNPQVLATGSVLLQAAAASELPGVHAVMEVRRKCNFGLILKSDVCFLSSFPKEVSSLAPYDQSNNLALFSKIFHHLSSYLLFLFGPSFFLCLSKLGNLKGVSSLIEEDTANQFGH